MKRPDNTEMDRLLRRHARLGGETLRAARDTSGVAAEAKVAGAHLDADELNAYAEGALPEAARPRYFAHLADCDNCRKLVTELTLASSAAGEGKARALAAQASPSKSWREWLAAIFSPPVLRYAVPALALFAVVIVAFVALRSQKDSSSIAQRGEEARYSAPSIVTESKQATENTATTGTVENHSNSNATALADRQNQTQPGVVAPGPAKPAPAEEGTSIVPQATPATPAIAQTRDSKDILREAEQTGKREQDEVAAAAPAPPPAQQAPGTSAPTANEPSDNRKREEAKKAKAGKDDSTGFVVDGNVAGGAITDKTEGGEDRKDVGRTAASRSAKTLPRNRPYSTRRSGPAGTATEKESSAETRSVGGRNFRRDGGAWVDTAYNPSRPTTNVRRGSEQYRSLVADEPGLRTIAEQLSGEVFVVWKSRAYRFY